MSDKVYSKEESIFISYSKALGIITVVIGHYGWGALTTYKPYFYHMPLFFIIGGILAKTIIGWKKFVLISFRRYIFFTAAWYTIIAILSKGLQKKCNINLEISFFDGSPLSFLIYPITQNMHNNVLFLTAWFIVAYFLSITSFRIFITTTSNLCVPYKQWLTLCIGLVIGFVAIEWISPLYDPYAKDNSWELNLLCQVSVGFMYISIGYVLRDFLHIFKSISVLLPGVVLMNVLVHNGTIHTMVMSWSRYPDGFLLHLLSSILGCYGLFSFARMFSVLKENYILKLLGEHSKDIMTLHILFFVLFDILFIYTGHIGVQEIKLTKLNVRHYVSVNAWPIYLFGGLFLPVIVSIIIEKGRSFFAEYFHRFE